jgi:hypothetical protein
MRHEQQSSPAGNPERPLKLLRGPAPLIVRQPEPNHAPPRELRCKPGEHPRIHRMPGPVGCHNDGDPNPSRLRSDSSRIQQQLGKGGNPAVPAGVTRRIGLKLQPPGPFGKLILGDLPEKPVKIVISPQHGPGDVVQPLKPEPATLVHGGQLRRPILRERWRQRHPVRPR